MRKFELGQGALLASGRTKQSGEKAGADSIILTALGKTSAVAVGSDGRPDKELLQHLTVTAVLIQIQKERRGCRRVQCRSQFQLRPRRNRLRNG